MHCPRIWRLSRVVIVGASGPPLDLAFPIFEALERDHHRELRSRVIARGVYDRGSDAWVGRPPWVHITIRSISSSEIVSAVRS